MLKLFCSDTINGSVNLLLDELKYNYNNEGEYIFIAPDRFSLSLEKDILERLGSFGVLNIDVVSFNRFAVKEVKDKKRYLSDEGGILVLSKIISENQKKLIHYARAAKSISFAKEMYDVITMLRGCGYSADDIDRVIPKATRGTLSKLKDISLITREYLSEMSKDCYDTTSRLESFFDTISLNQRIKSAHIYVGGFYRFTAQELQIIKRLSENALSVSISLTPTNNGKNADLYPQAMLRSLKALVKDAVVIQKDSGVKEPFYSLNRRVFSADNKSVTDGLESLTLYKEANVFDEINGIAKEILRLIKYENLRFKDIAIINCNQSYQDIIASIFEKNGIPFFIDKIYLLSQTVLAKYLFSVLECRAFGYRNDKVMAIVKSPLFGLSTEEAVMFENYLLKYNISFNGFKKEFSFGSEANIVEPIRKKLTALIKEGFNTQSTEEFARGAISIINDEALTRTYQSLLESMKDEKMLYNLNTQAKDKLTECLKNMESLLGQTTNDYEGHISILKSVAEAVKISLIPQLYDSVFIGNIKDSRLNDIKALFIMAASSDMLPSNKQSGAIISATDADILSDNDLRLYPLAKDLMREEQFLILDLLTKAERLYIGYSSIMPDGTPTGMSSTLKEVIFFTGKDTVSLNGVKLARYLAPLKEESLPKISPQLYFKKEQGGSYLSSVTQLECYFRCPYLHHLRYGLSLKPREEGRLKGLDIGRIIHRTMELFFKSTLGRLDDIQKEGKIEEYALKSADKCLAEEVSERFFIDAYTDYLLKRIKAECLRAITEVAKNILMGKYRPKYVEAEVGLRKNDFECFELKVADYSFKLQGKIDRIDVFSDKAAVIDYKTAGASVTAADIYYGLKLQLIWYSNIVGKNGLTPIGAFYLPIKDSYKDFGVSYSMQGFMVNYDNLLEDFDPELVQKAENSDKKVDSGHIPISLKCAKNGVEITKNSSLMESTEFRGYMKYSEDIIAKGLEEITKGSLEKSPISEVDCTKCEANRICLSKGQKAKRERLSGVSLGEIDEFHG